MSALSSISRFFHRFTLPACIRRRFERFGAFICWLGQCIVARNPGCADLEQSRSQVALIEEILGKYRGDAYAVKDLRIEDTILFKYLLEDNLPTEGQPMEGSVQFRADLGLKIAARDFDGAREMLARYRGSAVTVSDKKFESMLDQRDRANDKLETLLNDLMQPSGDQGEIKGYTGFEKDAVRIGSQLNCIEIAGRKIKVSPKFEHIKEALGARAKSGAKLFAEYFVQEICKIEGMNQKWIELIQSIIHQDYRKVVHKMLRLEPELVGDLGWGIGQRDSFPSTYAINFDRDKNRQIVALNVTFKSGYKVTDPQQEEFPIGYVKMASQVKIDFREDGSVRVLSENLDVKVVSSLKHVFEEIDDTRTYYRSPTQSVLDLVARGVYWVPNKASFGRVEMNSISPHIDRMEEYIRYSGYQERDEIRWRLGHLRRLYQETGQERYCQAVDAMVRALFEKESIHLDFRDVERRLAHSFEDQFADRITESEGDLRMYVGDNQTRSSTRTDLIFQSSNGRPQARYNSDSKYYAGDQVGEERRYFQALQKELRGRYPEESPVRDMVQALMTQATISEFTADLFEKTAEDGYPLPKDIPGAASASIVVRSDEHITYTLKTRCDLVGIDQGRVAGQIEVDAALDLRFENGAWIPRIMKRDITVIHPV